jgi:hypothetical protein
VTPTELLAALRAKRVDLVDRGGSIVVRPASALTAEERAAVVEHAAALPVLLRAPEPKDELVVTLTVDAILAQEAEAEERRLSELMAPRKVALFRTRRGVMQLSALLPHEVRDFERRKRISPEEVQEWARTRRSRLLW